LVIRTGTGEQRRIEIADGVGVALNTRQSNFARTLPMAVITSNWSQAKLLSPASASAVVVVPDDNSESQVIASCFSLLDRSASGSVCFLRNMF
jgi:hypothetical protein